LIFAETRLRQGYAEASAENQKISYAYNKNRSCEAAYDKFGNEFMPAGHGGLSMPALAW
jgi:hypothetical protein